MLSDQTRESITTNHKYDELDKKFKLYYLKSDKYIKDREQKLQDLYEECSRMAKEYGRFDEKFNEEVEKAKILEASHMKMQKELAKVNRLA